MYVFSSFIGEFYPNKTSLNAVSDIYGSVTDQVLHRAVQEFKDAATNRDKPIKDLNAGFRNYVRKGYLSASFTTKPQTHAQMSKQINQNMDGKVIAAPKSMKEIEEMLNQNQDTKRRLQHG